MLHNYFSKNTKSKNNKLALALFVFFTLLSIIIMLVFDAYLKTNESPDGIASFELAKDSAKSIKIIEVWKNGDVLQAAGLSLGFDFVFIFFYTVFISLLLFLVIKNKAQNYTKAIGKFLIGAMLLAASLDIIENIALIKLLLGNTQELWSQIAYYAAVPKFLIILLSLLFILMRFILLFIASLSKN